MTLFGKLTLGMFVILVAPAILWLEGVVWILDKLDGKSRW